MKTTISEVDELLADANYVAGFVTRQEPNNPMLTPANSEVIIWQKADTAAKAVQLFVQKMRNGTIEI